VHNENGSKRVVVTKALPGDRWLQILIAAGCRVEVSQSADIIQDVATVKKLIGSHCDGVIGQLTEVRAGPHVVVCEAGRGLEQLQAGLVCWQGSRSGLPAGPSKAACAGAAPRLLAVALPQSA
jgi:hypothetical protein